MNEQIWKKLKQELKSYCTTNEFKTVALGLSGGIDSALTAVLAADTLGGENVTAIMMRTRYTSPLSLEIAREIAKLNRLQYHELDIEPLIETETNFLHLAFNEEPKGIVLENLQARTRGKILMAWSNQYGSLVLACGNKSEIATGYCTLYGDTCGGLAPIGNLYKTQVFELAKWRNAQTRVLPSEVIVRAPSAELALNQKDENTLPPYPVLDRILKLYLDEQKSRDELLAQGEQEQTVDWIINRYRKTAFKRAQLPPALEI